MRRFAYTALCVVGMLCALASCQNDELAEPFSGTADRLTARKGELLTRSVPPNSHFRKYKIPPVGIQRER